jgi:hypothetical protein
VGGQLPQGADLVDTHQPAVADDVGGQDSGEPAFHGLPVDHRVPAPKVRQKTGTVGQFELCPLREIGAGITPPPGQEVNCSTQADRN